MQLVFVNSGRAIFLMILLLGVPRALGQSMDPTTRNLLIGKLEKVLIGLPKADSSHSSVSLRLADLYSERARVDAMKELESGCSPCVAGVQDRKKAIKIYSETLSSVPEENRGRIIFHIAHLSELLGDSSKAESTYQEIIRTSKNEKLRAEAHAALGEIYFKQRRFAQARAQFEEARKGPLNQKGLAAYRIGWSHFNEGQLPAALSELKTILKNPELLSRQSDSAVTAVDKQFHEEVSRDYAMFLARTPASREQMAEVFALSPDSARLSNLEFLATEFERLGVKERAVVAWGLSQDRQSQPRNRLEGHVRLTQLHLDMNQAAQATQEFEKALALWPQVGCQSGCEELQSRLRKFVIDWHRTNQKTPKAEVLKAYEDFLAVFSNDVEMTYWAAGLAKDLKNHESARVLFGRSVELATSRLVASAIKDAKERAALETLHEGSLLSLIEMAESEKNEERSRQAYDLYLGKTRKADKKLEVQYQKAYSLYKSEKYNEAAEALRAVAKSDLKDSGQIKLQAAELSLDALALLKDADRIALWSRDFAQQFPTQRSDFVNVQRKTALNRSAEAATSGDLGGAWALLVQTDMSGAETKDKVTYLKNKILLAEKLMKFSEARLAVQDLLKVPGLGAEDREFALTKQGWLAELALDFRTAFEANRAVPLKELTPDQKALRLAILAELSGERATPLYDEYLRLTRDRDAARSVAARLVRASSKPQDEFLKSQKTLREDPKLFATLGLEVFAQTGDLRIVRSVLSDKGAASTPQGHSLARNEFFQELQKFDSRISAMTIDQKSQASMGRTIKARVKAVEDAEAMAARAVSMSDYLSQFASLSVLGREVGRLYNDLIALPVPDGLSAEEEGQYLQLLSAQAAPYQVKAQDVQTKLQEMKSSGSIQVVLTEFAALQGPVRKFLANQLSAFAKLAGQETGQQVLAALNQAEQAGSPQPTLAEIEAARKRVLADPLNPSGLMSLSQLERKMGREVMAAYLEARALKASEEKR